jgi:hypothetical protein
MKWTVARRYIRPYMKKRRALKRKFRNIFYTKQQLRVFYGKQKESAFRNFFKSYLGGAKGRNNIFAAALERRADVFLFRLRLLPTIYASHQYIHHFGVIINGRKEISPYALVKPGDVVTFDKEQWLPFVEYLYERLYWRAHGLNLWKRRQFKSLRKKSWWFNKVRFFKKANLVLLRKFNFVANNVLKVNKVFVSYLAKFLQKLKHLAMLEKDSMKQIEIKQLQATVTLLLTNYKLNLKVLIKRFVGLTKQKWRLKLWKWRNYYRQYLAMIGLLFKMYTQFKQYFAKVQILELKLYQTVFLLSGTTEKMALMGGHLIKNTSDIAFDLKNKNEVALQFLQEKIFLYKIQYKNLIQKQYKLKQHIALLQYKSKKLTNNNWTAYSYGASHFKIQNKLKLKCFDFLEKKIYASTLIKKRLNWVWKKIEFFTKKKHNFEAFTVEQSGKITEIINRMPAKDETTIFQNLIDNKMVLIEKKLVLFKIRIELLLNFILKQRIKRFNLKTRLIKNFSTGKRILKKTNIMYYLTKRRLKKERKLAIPRLKKVHWYLPSYIYFDVRTLRAVFLYNPKAEEIMHSFKCSLKDVHSFYRALGL